MEKKHTYPARLIIQYKRCSPIQQVPQSFESLPEALNLTLPDACIDIVVRCTNQKYNNIAENTQEVLQLVVLGVADLSQKKKYFLLWVYRFISGTHRATKNPISDLYDSKFLTHFKAALSRDRLLLLIKFSGFDDVNTRDDRKDDRFGHIREAWDTFNNRCRELYGLRPHTTIDCKKCCKKSVVAVDLGSTCPVSQGGIALSI